MNFIYDYLIVGSGLFGAVFAHEATAAGKRCLVLEKRSHIGGNVFTEEIDGITVHRYGAHIFHTSQKDIWDYVRQFADFNNFINAPIANYQGEIYNLPFNMNTFSRMWGISRPEEAKARITSQRSAVKGTPKNLEEQAISLVGRDLYEKLIQGYTEKQWGRPCGELPASIIRRIPVRFTYDNNYFTDSYQGIPIGGYTRIIEKMLAGSETVLNTDFNAQPSAYRSIAKKTVYTGTIDSYFGFCLGPLEYRTLRFETETLNTDNYQGNAVVNYTDAATPWTRIIEHKHFTFGTQPGTVITREYPAEWTPEAEPFYPINDRKNQALYRQYALLAAGEKNVIFGGRLGRYMYSDMDTVIHSALALARQELGPRQGGLKR